jgi:hypothetical protein
MIANEKLDPERSGGTPLLPPSLRAKSSSAHSN